MINWTWSRRNLEDRMWLGRNSEDGDDVIVKIGTLSGCKTLKIKSKFHHWSGYNLHRHRHTFLCPDHDSGRDI